MKAHCHRITQKSRFGNVLGNIEHISREALRSRTKWGAARPHIVRHVLTRQAHECPAAFIHPCRPAVSKRPPRKEGGPEAKAILYTLPVADMSFTRPRLFSPPKSNSQSRMKGSGAPPGRNLRRFP